MTSSHPVSLTRYAWLSIAAAIITISLKSVAYGLTGSVGLLSDALESGVNLAAAMMALAMLTLAARPPDENHAYGHSKAEYFSSVVEGVLIVLAAGGIAWTAVPRLFHPEPLEQVGLGLAISLVGSVINFGVAQILQRAGRRYSSITLEADAHHLMADVWTSVGVVAGIGGVFVTGWQRLDAVVALVVAANIVRIGVRLVRDSAVGLLDVALPEAEQHSIRAIFERYHEQGIAFHALRTRQAGRRRFVAVHVLVPGHWTVYQGHQLLEQIEQDIRAALAYVSIDTHLEALDDPSSWQDQALDRDDVLSASQET